MGSHLVEDEFQSDKYPTTPRGFVPLKVSDPIAQPLLWEYAHYHRFKDAEFSEDLLQALKNKGYEHTESVFEKMARLMMRLHIEMAHGRDEDSVYQFADWIRDEMDSPWHKLTAWGRDTVNAISVLLYDNEQTKESEKKRKCNACKVEAEFGGPDDPHPIDRRFHTCVKV